MGHPQWSDAFKANPETGFTAKNILDPRKADEKKRVWALQKELVALGYPAEYDPIKKRAWTADECRQVKGGHLTAVGTTRTKIDGSPLESNPDTMDMLSVYAGLRNAGKIPAPGMTEAQVRQLYKATLEEFKTPKIVGPVVTPAERVALTPKPLSPVLADTTQSEAAVGIPYEKWHRGKLLGRAKSLGIKCKPSMTREVLVPLIREAERGANASTDGQPRTS